jgi:chromosome segregation ATPase
MNNGKGLVLRYLLLSFVLLSTAAFAASTDIKDVPLGHWAYDAVRTLVGRGYLSLGADGAFRGNEPVDRYTFASVLAQMLEEFDRASVGATGTDVQLLRKLTDEYRAELVQYYAAQEKISRNVEAADRRFSTLDEKINEALVAFGDLSTRTDALQRQIADNAALNASLGTQTRDLRRDVDSVGQNLLTIDRNLSTRMSQVEGETSILKERLDVREAELVADLNAIRREAQALAAGVKLEQDQSWRSLEKQTSDQLVKLRQLDGQLSKLEQDTKQMRNSIITMESSLNRSIGDHDAQILDLQQALQAQKQSLSSETELRSASLQALQSKLAVLESSLGSGVASQDRKLDKHVAELKQELSIQETGLETETAARTQALQKLEGQIATLQSSLDAQNKDLRGQLGSEVASQDKKLEKHIADLRLELAAQKAGLESETAARTRALQTLDQQLSALDAQDKDLQSQIAALQSGISAQNLVLEDKLGMNLASQDRKLDSRVNELRQELAAQKTGLETETVTRTKAVDTLEAQIAALQSSLDQQNKDLRGQLGTEVALQDSKMQKQIADLQQELATQKTGLQTETAARAHALQRLEAQIAALQADLDDQSLALDSKLGANLASQERKLDSYVADLRQGLAAQKTDLETETATRTVALQKLEAQVAALQSDTYAQNLALEGKLLISQAAQEDKLEKHVADLRQELAAQGTALETETLARAQTLQTLETRIAELQSEIEARDLALEGKLSMNLAAQDRKLERSLADLRQELSGQRADFDAEIAACESSLETIEAQVVILQSDLAAQDRDLRDTLSNEIASQNKRVDGLIANLRRELSMQRADLTAEATARAAALQALEEQITDLQSHLAAQDKQLAVLQEDMATRDEALAQRLGAELADMQRRENELRAKHEADTAALTKQNEEQANQFQQALTALAAGLQTQIDGLKTELAQTQRELNQATAKLLAAESKLGLSDDQLAQLDQRVQDGLASHLTAALARERSMEKRISDLEHQHEANQVKVDKEIKSTKSQAWTAAALSALLGVFVVP